MVTSVHTCAVADYATRKAIAEETGHKSIGSGSIAVPVPDRIKAGTKLSCKVTGSNVILLHLETEKGKYYLSLIQVTEGSESFNVSFAELPKVGSQVDVQFTEYEGKTYGKIV